jgi:hypothetical protein
LFTLRPDGALTLSDADAFDELLSELSVKIGKIKLDVKGSDTDGRTHHQALEFYDGAYKVVGQLVAPPSNPGLSVAGITISADLMDRGPVFSVVSDANGNFEFPLRLPAGILRFESVTGQNGKYYYGEGMRALYYNTLRLDPPVWRGDGSTGIMEKIIDIRDLTASGPVELVIDASARNVRDGLLPTVVNAALSTHSKTRGSVSVSRLDCILGR